MKKHLCWQPDTVAGIINPFAEHIGDSLFRAVHSDWPLRVGPPKGEKVDQLDRAALPTKTPAAFLEDFLAHPTGAFAVVLGTTGSGKSHLVHWMRINAPEQDNRVVLTIPKSRTNLRSIIDMLIQALPDGPERERFSEMLGNTTQMHHTARGQRQQLLNDLAQAIREEDLGAHADDAAIELQRTLPNLFQDPEICQNYYLGDGTIIASLAHHIFATASASDRPEQRQRFTAQDFPDFNSDYARASAPAREAIDVLQSLEDFDLPDLHIETVNRNLEQAIRRCLSFSGDSIEELMLALRRYLKREGKELVLLVEEFARLQGIDRVLLQTLTTQGDDDHCTLRSAIAVTSGFFDTVAETAYMRATHIVDMDQSAAQTAERTVTAQTVARFSAPYLNAVRMGKDALEEWHSTAEPGETARSMCDTCPHIEACHAGFGAVDGYGLYPFTPRALEVMARGTMPAEMVNNRLNPRVLQQEVLKPVLDTHAAAIEAGAYPNEAVMETTRVKSVLDMAERNSLKSGTPGLQERWHAAITLYGDGRTVHNLPPQIHEAFDLPTIADAANAPSPQPAVPDPTPSPAPEERAASAVISPSVAAAPEHPQHIRLREWADGGGFDNNLARDLRDALYPLLVNAIDWDLLGLQQTAFASKTGSGSNFRQRDISFEGWTDGGKSGSFSLRITRSDDTAFALQGLLRARNGVWDFPDAARSYGQFLDHLAMWKADLEAQFKSAAAPTPTWCIATAAVELLAIEAALRGALPSTPTTVQIVDAALREKRRDGGVSFSDPLKSLRSKLDGDGGKNHALLRNLVRARLGSMKGGQVGLMLDGGRLQGMIRKLRQGNWQLQQVPPEEANDGFAKLYRTVQQGLAPALEAEADARRDWLETSRQTFGPDAEPKQVIEGANALLASATEAGLPSQSADKRLREALETFQPRRQVELLDALVAATALDDPTRDPVCLGRSSAADAGIADTLRQRFEAYVTGLETRIEQENRHQSVEATKILESKKTISETLTGIDADLAALCDQPKEDRDAA